MKPWLQARYSAFGFAGQKCSACSRLIVLEGVYDAFVKRFVASTRSLQVGDPTHPGTDVGPVIDTQAAEKIRGCIEAGKAEATLLYGDEALRADVLGKPLIGPHIFEVTSADCPLMQEGDLWSGCGDLESEDF